MKKLLVLLVLTASLSCSKDEDNGNNNPPDNNNGGGNGGGNCGTYLGYQLYKDSEGCYYNGPNYAKVYVDASNCTCD
ncbi:MAG: hypothetical protein JNK79_10645 [Chitinophagaceae bacterium]|nr:hypothetical protein [Chitinophagaceae bacterium]